MRQRAIRFYLVTLGLLVVLVVVVAWPRQARQPKAEFTPEEAALPGTENLKVAVHRRAAGEPGEDGWYLTESTEGGYSVKVPFAFNDITGIGRTEKGQVARMYAVGTKTPEGIQFTAVKGARTDNKPIPEALESLAKGFGKDVKGKRHVTHAGMSGIELRLIGPERAGVSRVLLSDTTAVTLTVENKAAPVLTSEIEQDAAIFFDSFRLK